MRYREIIETEIEEQSTTDTTTAGGDYSDEFVFTPHTPVDIARRGLKKATIGLKKTLEDSDEDDFEPLDIDISPGTRIDRQKTTALSPSIELKLGTGIRRIGMIEKATKNAPKVRSK